MSKTVLPAINRARTPSLVLLPLIIAAVLFLFVLSFFRDPERRIPADPDLVVSPADGKIVRVELVVLVLLLAAAADIAYHHARRVRGEQVV